MYLHDNIFDGLPSSKAPLNLPQLNVGLLCLLCIHSTNTVVVIVKETKLL